jgi:hypothetical protein
MTLQAAGRRWASFNLREDQLANLRIGSPVHLADAGGVAGIDGHVAEIMPRGEFATWRAARAVGDHDLNTFQLRVDTDTGGNKLQPGMTVWLRRQ